MSIIRTREKYRVHYSTYLEREKYDVEKKNHMLISYLNGGIFHWRMQK